MTQDRRQAGDTLIEVLVAIAVLGAIITIAYSVMNRGFASAQNSLDRTNTQNVAAGQVSLLRAAYKRSLNGDSTYWNRILANVVSTAQQADGCTPHSDRSKLFYFDPESAIDPLVPTSGPLVAIPYSTTASLTRQSTTAKPGDGLWIEVYRESANSYLFYVKSCWNALYNDGTSDQRQTKTIVRLYAP